MKIHDCNNCMAFCSGDVLRNERGEFKRFTQCRGQAIPQPMKTPLLAIALMHKGGGTVINKILSAHEMRFQEIDRYPYFRLEV